MARDPMEVVDRFGAAWAAHDNGQHQPASDVYFTSAVGSYGLPNALRLTVGGEEANRLVVKALAEFMGKPA